MTRSELQRFGAVLAVSVVAVVLHFAGTSGQIVFFVAAVALAALAWALAEATEQAGESAVPRASALLNATFGNLPEVVIVPIVGNIAENIVALKIAYQDRMDFSMLVSLGSSLQVALGVAPVLVFASLLTAHHFDLVFPTIQVIALAAAVTITALIAADGESNWLEGAQLIAVYAIIATSFWYL